MLRAMLNSSSGDAAWSNVSTMAPLASGTCDLTFGGTTGDGTVAYTQTNKSTWQRFGDVVRIVGVIQTNAVTATPTGNLVLRGLPFAPRTAAGAGGTGAGGAAAAHELWDCPSRGLLQHRGGH